MSDRQVMLLSIGYDADHEEPWVMENGRSALKNEKRAKTRADLLVLISTELDTFGEPDDEDICPNCGRPMENFMHSCPSSNNYPEIYGCPVCNDNCSNCVDTE